MKQLDFYEFSAIVAPGCVALFGITYYTFSWKDSLLNAGFSVGAAGLFLVLAYVAGHLVQGLGNIVESIWWKCWRGMPTDWVRTSAHSLLAQGQRDRLLERARTELRVDSSDADADSWYAAVRQMESHVRSTGTGVAKIDTLLGNYGLNRGIASAFVCIVLSRILLSTGLTTSPLGDVPFLLVLFGFSMYRMHRFGVHYGRELLVQYLSLPVEAHKPTAPSAQSEPLAPLSGGAS